MALYNWSMVYNQIFCFWCFISCFWSPLPISGSRDSIKKFSHSRYLIQKLLLSEDTEIFDNIQIRGILGKAYYSPVNKLVVGIHKEGDLKDQIVKTQPLSSAQLEKLCNLNILD